MFVIAANLTAIPEQKYKFLKIVGDLAKGSCQEPGCQRFEVYQSIDDPNEFIMYEEWTDMGEEATKLHTAAEYYKRYSSERNNIVAKQSVKKYQVMD